MSNCSYAPNGQLPVDAQFISGMRSKRVMGCTGKFGTVEANDLTVNNAITVNNLAVTDLTVVNDASVGNDLTVTATTTSRFVYDSTNVKYYGAVGDGVTDDTVAIQTAIDSSLTVFFPQGIYRVTATLRVKRFNQDLYGVGDGSLILHSGDYGYTMIVERTDLDGFLSNISITRLRFFVDSSAPFPTNGAHLWMNKSAGVLQHLTISEMFSGLRLTASVNTYVDNILINGGQFSAGVPQAGSYLMLVDGTTVAGTLASCSEVFVSNFNMRSQPGVMENGIVVRAVDGLWFSNGHVGFTSNACCAILPNDNAQGIQSLHFSNVYFDGNFNSTYGVLYDDQAGGYVNPLTSHNYTGCTFSLCQVGFYGQVATCKGINIVGGIFFTNSLAAARLLLGSHYVIKGATVWNNQGPSLDVQVDFCDIDVTVFATSVGVRISAGADNNTIRGTFETTVEDMQVQSGTDNRVDINTNRSSTVASVAALPLIYGHDTFRVTGTTNITSIAAGFEFNGRRVTLLFSDVLTFTDGGNLNLAGNFVTSAGDTITLVYGNGAWNEVGRSVN